MARRVCLWCGSTPLSREHVNPRWLTTVLPEQDKQRAQDMASYQVGPSGLLQPGGDARRTVQEGFTEMTSKAVCRPCNHGWMETLESAARPILTPMIQGHPTVLTAADLKILGRWAVKSAFIANTTGGEDRADLDDAAAKFYRQQQCPPETYVWIGAHNNPDFALLNEVHGFLVDGEGVDMSQRPNTMAVTFGLGRLVLQTILTSCTSLVHPQLDKMTHRAVRRVWPHPAGFRWSLQRKLSAIDLYEFTNSMALALSTKPMPGSGERRI